MDDQRFRPEQRVRRAIEFRTVYDHGRSVADRWLVVYALANSLDTTRLGLSVSKRIGNAVKRNRWKRRLREAFRLGRPRLPQGFDLVVVVRGGPSPDFEQLQRSLTTLAESAAKPRRAKRS